MAEWNWSSRATRFAGIPISVKRLTSPRMPLRIARLARTGPRACSPATFGEVKYTCRTSTATEATSRHHWAASPAVFGGLAIVMKTFAPRSASLRRRISVFARYCAVVAVHGAGVWAPKSSFSAIHGVAQPRHRDREVEEAVRLRDDPGRVGRDGRRADAVVEVEVEEDRRGAGRPRGRRLLRPGRERERQPGLLRQRRVMSREVDPHGLPVGDSAFARARVPCEGETDPQ